VNSAEAVAWLDGHVNLETGLGRPPGPDRRREAPTLDRIRTMVDLLGSPQLSYPTIHLTGTNGKTSVARMVTALLVAEGLRVGTYTSPHLTRVNERMSWDGDPIPDDALAEALETVATVEPHLAEAPSYFEIVTAAALHWFADIAVDVAVVEVGLGGTWDATNVVHGEVAVITNISIDHVEYLGPTREGIAADKAGIIEAGATLVLGETDPALVPLFEARQPSTVVRRDRDFELRANRLAHGGRLVTVRTPRAQYEEVFLALHGAHQADNAAIALATAEAFLDRALDGATVEEAFATVRSPGRLEVVRHQPLVLLDGAHNVAGAHALADALAEEFVGGPRTLVVGLLQGKDPLEMLGALRVVESQRLVCCRPPSGRALEPSEIAAAAYELGLDVDQVEVIDDVGAAVRDAVANAGADGQVVVTGSLYVVGAARTAMGVA
jgi:dihydrofolate synthase/folylpolyglutamate synthase